MILLTTYCTETKRSSRRQPYRQRWRWRISTLERPVACCQSPNWAVRRHVCVGRCEKFRAAAVMNTPGRFRWLVELRTSWSGGRGPVSGSQWGTSQVALLVTAWLRRPNTTPLRHAGYEASIKCTCTFNPPPTHICVSELGKHWFR